MTIAKSFALYLEDQGIATLGNNLFIGSAPLDAQDNIFWIVATGGTPIVRNTTGEKQKSYTINLFCRNISAEQIDTILQNLEETINMKGCIQLEGFETLQIEATTFATDQDLDNEDRSVGLLQVTVTTYL